MTNEELKTEINALLDRHPEMYDQILQLLRENIPDFATTREPNQVIG